MSIPDHLEPLMPHPGHPSRASRLAVAGLALLVAAVVAPGPAAAADPSPLEIQSTTVLDRSTIHPGPAASTGTFQGTTTGSFVSTGAIEAAGTETTDLMFTGVFAPDSDVVHGVATFTGTDGTFTLTWQAVHRPFENPVFGGSWVLSDATGAYAGLHGSGTVVFSITGEASDNPVIAEHWTGSLQ